MLSPREQLFRECERLLNALEVGLEMMKTHYPDLYEKLKERYEKLWIH
jgi:hypothetical protein